MMVQDSLEARSIVERFTDTVADTGVKVKPEPMIDVLGQTPEKAQEWANMVRQKFHMFCNSKSSVLNGNMNIYQMIRFVEFCQQRDNDYFVRFHYSKKRSLPHPLQLSMIDPDQVDGAGYSDGKQWPNVEAGIEVDENGTEIAYHVFVLRNKELKLIRIPRFTRGGRTQIVHGYWQEEVWQRRGYSRLAHAMQDLSNITDFSLSHIRKAVSQSQIAMVVESNSDSPATDPFDDIASRRGSGPDGLANTDARNINGPNVPPMTERLGYDNIPEAQFSTPGAVGVFSLQGREKLVPFYNSSPSEHYSNFVKSFMGHLSASLSIPLEVVLMQFNQNYSASRACLLLFWRVAEIWRMELASDFLNPLYEAWLSEEIARGGIQAPGFSDPTLRQAWLNSSWRGAPMPNIDPAKTADADMKYLEMGAQTLDDVAANFNGSDGAMNRATNSETVDQLSFFPWSSNLVVTSYQSSREDGSIDTDFNEDFDQPGIKPAEKEE
jgi:lambda family phage portal protein